jgi:predicted ATPase/DNA-binding SARP family transcriptional activator
MDTEQRRATLGVALLGPLDLRVDQEQVPVPGARRRALLAVLALAQGRVVGTGRLVDTLWPDDPPAGALAALYNHVSRLRGHLGPGAGRLERSSSGYRLRLAPEEFDVATARRWAAEVADSDAPDRRAELARSALALWRGASLEEFRALPGLQGEAVGLDELRLRLVDDLLEARLALGETGVTSDAAAAAAAVPLRERTALLLVRSLAAEGRAADALAAAAGFRRVVVEETGLDPGPALRELEEAVAAGRLGASPASGVRRTIGRPDGPFVGRRQDRDEVLRLLGSHAVVTLTGPGGVGKTRLALEVAADPEAAPDGGRGDVVVADLAAVDSADRLCAAVASMLGLRISGQVGPSQVAAGLAGRRMLLLLDNCEHLPQACRDLVVALRRDAPGVQVLATSRVTLHVPGEYVVRLQPLPIPRDAHDPEALRRQPGVRAFVEHARRRRAGYELADSDGPALVEVLRRLDGLPLGIELAARQVALMPLVAVRDRLDRALDLGTGRTAADDDRQRTLRLTIESSYRLLGDAERTLLRALAPFPGGADLATVEGLAAGLDGDPLDLLHALVDSSLVAADPASGRVRLLYTVRAFLLDELAADHGLQEAETHFLDRCLSTAQELGAGLLGPDEPDHDRRLRAELDNLRAARDVARAHGRTDVLVGITLALDEVVTWRDLREPWSWAVELATDPGLVDHPRRVELLGSAAEALRLTGDLDGADELARAAFALFGGPATRTRSQLRRAWAARGSVAHFRGDFVTARDCWLRSGEGHTAASGAYLGSAALAAAYHGDADGARALLDRAHAMIADSGCWSHAAFAAYVEGELVAASQPHRAIPHYLGAIERSRQCGATFVEGVASVALASVRTRTGDVSAAAEGFGYLLDLWRRTGQRTQLWTTARNAASLLAAAGRPRCAALLLLTADTEPAAAAVGPAIARHSGRVFVPLDRIVPATQVDELTAEARRLGPDGVLDRARAELAALASQTTASVTSPTVAPSASTSSTASTVSPTP